MDQATFSALVSRIQAETMELLVRKGAEYAGSEDRLANFRRGAANTGLEPLTVLFVYMSKHYDAVASYVKACERGERPELTEPITGRLADLINYCVLAWALVVEEGEGEEPKAQPAQAPQKPIPKIRVRAIDGRSALLDGQLADDFLLLVNRGPREQRGSRVAIRFQDTSITEWCFEDEPAWRSV